jgi:hypothetical protein
MKYKGIIHSIENFSPHSKTKCGKTIPEIGDDDILVLENDHDLVTCKDCMKVIKDEK